MYLGFSILEMQFHQTEKHKIQMNSVLFIKEEQNYDAIMIMTFCFSLSFVSHKPTHRSSIIKCIWPCVLKYKCVNLEELMFHCWGSS